MKRLFKGLFYFFATVILLLTIAFAIAYWNRDKIREQITAQLNSGINGEFNIRKLNFTLFNDFPHVTVTLRDVSLRETVPFNHPDFFAAEKIFLDVNLYSLWHKQIDIHTLKVENANLFMFRTHDGYTNLSIFKTDSVTSADSNKQNKSPFLLSINNIEFRNVDFIYTDSLKKKSHRFKFIATKHKVLFSDSVYETHINGKMHFSGLTFKEENGSFLSDKKVTTDLHLKINRNARLLTIEPSFLQFEKSQIGISGFFELRPEGNFNLRFKSDKLNIPEAVTLVDRHLNTTLSKFEIDQPASVDVLLKGKSIPNHKPEVDVHFRSSDTQVRYAKMLFSKFSFTGAFTNHLDSTRENDNSNSRISFSSFNGLMDDFPIRGTADISELQDPLLKLNIITEMILSDLNHHLDTTRFRFKKGQLITKINYQGRLAEYMDGSRTRYDGQLHGETTVKDGAFYFITKQLYLDKIDALFEFNEERLKINKLDLTLNGSSLQMTGLAKNFIPFFIQPKDKGYIQINIASPRLDLTPFASKKAKKKTTKQLTQDKKRLSDMMDNIFTKLEFDLNIKAAQLVFKRFNATNFTGRVALSHQVLEAKPVSMNVAGGKMNLNFRLSDLSKNINPMVVSAKVTNARIKDFFTCFDNFNQNTVESKHLEGTISTDVQFAARVDDNLQILAPSMRGNISLNVKNGRLINFEPMENMSNFLFRKRDFSDIQFAELNSDFLLNGSDLDIKRMEIQSTVLSLFVHGRYSFTDSTSLSIQLPLSNLKKRDKTYKPKNVGADAKTGPSVFLHIYKDAEGKIAIAYDPFKKWAKQ
jgi:uncharacterized protein involved in outer membrane biogenesis